MPAGDARDGLDEEIGRLARRVRSEPRSTAFVALADACRRAGRLDEAVRVLREGFRVHPDHAPARVVLARVHLEAGHPDLARAVLDDVVAVDPENLAATALAARMRVDGGDLTGAKPLIDRLRQVSADDPAVLLYDRLRAHEVGPRAADPFDHAAVAARLLRSGRYDRAVAVWRRKAERSPDDPAVGRAIATIERAAAGHGDAEGEPPGPRGPLPGLVSVLDALRDDDDGPTDAPLRGPLGALWRAP